jgi:Flp pilus assembly protein TadG
MRYRSYKRRRRGGAIAEGVLTTSVLLSLMLGMIDMGIAVFRMHVISEAARQGARRAIVHGGTPSNKLGGWGATSFSGSGTSTDPKVTEIQPFLSTLDPSSVTINVTWPDGDNNVEHRVTYQVNTTWTPMMTWIFGSPTYTLTAQSTMLIAH